MSNVVCHLQKGAKVLLCDGNRAESHLVISFPPYEHTNRPKLLGICSRPSVKGLRRTKMLTDSSIRYQVSRAALKRDAQREKESL